MIRAGPIGSLGLHQVFTGQTEVSSLPLPARGWREGCPITRQATRGVSPKLPEQAREELPEHRVGAPKILELGGTEAEDLVPGELDFAVGTGALGVHGGIRAAVGAVVGGAVDFEDDPVAMGQQEQEVHAEAQHGLGAALTGSLGVPVQPDLGQERREAREIVPLDVVVDVEQVPLQGRVGGQAAAEPLVQRGLGLAVVGELRGFPPPCLQVAPQDALVGGPVVDQDLVGVGEDLDVVVNDVGDPDVQAWPTTRR